MFHRKIIEVEAPVGRSSVKKLAWKFSMLATYTEYDLHQWCFSKDSPKNFRTVKEQSFFHAVGTPEETDGYSKIGYRWVPLS